jgi:histone H3/H4
MAALSTIAKQSGGSHSDDIYTVALERIKIVPGFNYRDLTTPDAVAKINAMAEDMLDPDIGYNQKKTMIVPMDGDVPLLVDGHRRHAALALANARGAGIMFVPCVTEERNTSDLERDYELFSAGEPLTIQEKAVGVARQRKRGESFAKIAARLKVTEQTVKSWLEVVGAPEEILEAINQGEISTTEGRKLRKAGEARAKEILTEAREHAHAAGRKQIRPRDIKEVQKPRTEPVSLCSLAVAAVLACERADFTLPAIVALRDHIGEATMAKARESADERVAA